MPVAPAGIRWHDDTDVGIVGAGPCGLAAAHAAAGDAIRVTVWERDRAAGGSAARDGVWFAAAASRFQHEAGVPDRPEDLAADILARNRHRGDAALAHQLAGISGTLAEWLAASVGVDIVLLPHRGDPGHRCRRLHGPRDGDGRAMLQRLAGAAARRGARLLLGTPVEHLWSSADGSVLGVRIKPPRRSAANVRCRALVLATGGFGANPDLVAEHLPGVAGLPYLGASTTTGDALGWAREAGAAVRDLGAFHSYPYVAVGTNLAVPWDLLACGGILVNQRGERFVDESRSPVEVLPSLLAQPGRVAYLLFGHEVFRAFSEADACFARQIVPRAVRRADDVAALAGQFRIAADTLAATVTAYNAACPDAADPLGRPGPRAPLGSPLHAIRVGPALQATLGGLVTDTEGRVLASDGSPIPGLYAGGGAVGGLAGPGGDGYLEGCGLLAALGLGRIGGRQAASLAMARRQPAAAPPGGDATDGAGR